jgi:DNA-binding response OmpR family regulator
MKVLVCEDDTKLRKGLVEILTQEGYQTVEAGNGADALKLFSECSPDLVCLDIMMPQMSGYDVCRKIRSTNEQVPVIFISAKSEEVDKVLGLELGADDYIQKPFGMREVIARIRAVTRRTLKRKEPSQTDDDFTIGPWRVVPSELQALTGDQAIELSLREVQILRLFSRNDGKVLNRDTIFDECWGVDHYPNSRTLEQHISKLRKKVEADPKNPQIIQTVHGVGYRYRSDN